MGWQEEQLFCDSTQFVHLTAFIFIIFTFASRSQHAPQIITTIIRTHCARRATTFRATPVVMAMSRTGRQWTARDSRAEYTECSRQYKRQCDSVHCATRSSLLSLFVLRLFHCKLRNKLLFGQRVRKQLKPLCCRLKAKAGGRGRRQEKRRGEAGVAVEAAVAR